MRLEATLPLWLVLLSNQWKIRRTMKCEQCGTVMRVDKRECSGSTCCTWYECDICRRVRLTSSRESAVHENAELANDRRHANHFVDNGLVNGNL